MTTIAFNRNVIAWDSRIMNGVDEFYDSAQYSDKVRVHDGKIFASCGDAGMLDFLIEWWEAGARWDELPDYTDTSDDGKPSWELLVITQYDRMIYTSGAKGAILRPPPVFAIGSGSLAARAAMYCGRDPVGAVETAAALCVGTGGEIQFLEINEHVSGE